MLIDRLWLETALTKKFETLTLHTIVNEAFLGALPFDKEGITDSDIESLSQYSLDVVSKLGGFNLVKSAMENCTDIYRGFFLKDLYLTCSTSALEAMRRIRDDDEVIKSDRSKANEIVDEAAFTDNEYKSFVRAADNLNLDKVSEVIEKKTIDVLKREKEEFLKEEDKERRLMEVYTDVNGEGEASEEETLDSIINTYIPIGKAKHYISLFSRLQSDALNTVMVYESNTSMLPIESIKHVTNHKFLNAVKEPQDRFSKLENILPSIAIESYFKCEDKELHMDKATFVAITVYTMFETLKTMGLYTPSLKETEAYILDKVESYHGEDDVKCEIKKIIDSIMDEAKLTDKQDELLQTRTELERVKTLVANNTIVENPAPVLESLCEAIDTIEDKIITITSTDEPQEEKEDDLAERRRKENDLAAINRLYSSLCLDPFIKTIRIKFEKDGYVCPPDIEVDGLTEDGSCKKQNVISLESPSSIKDTKEYVKALLEKSKLSTGTKTIEFYTTLVGTSEIIMN